MKSNNTTLLEQFENKISKSQKEVNFNRINILHMMTHCATKIKYIMYNVQDNSFLYNNAVRPVIQIIPHCWNNSKIKYQNHRKRSIDIPNTQIHDRLLSRHFN
jgi:hypothetical protein